MTVVIVRRLLNPERRFLACEMNHVRQARNCSKQSPAATEMGNFVKNSLLFSRTNFNCGIGIVEQ